MATLNIQPKVTRIWEITPKELEQIIASELGVPLSEVSIHFVVADREYDDRFGPDYQFTGVKVTTR